MKFCLIIVSLRIECNLFAYMTVLDFGCALKARGFHAAFRMHCYQFFEKRPELLRQ